MELSNLTLVGQKGLDACRENHVGVDQFCDLGSATGTEFSVYERMQILFANSRVVAHRCPFRPDAGGAAGDKVGSRSRAFLSRSRARAKRDITVPIGISSSAEIWR